MTGYVHHMVEKNQTFPQFAMSCARAFGALVEMRDEGMDAKIPDEIKPEPYHKKAAAEARKELVAFEAMTEDASAWRGSKPASGGRWTPTGNASKTLRRHALNSPRWSRRLRSGNRRPANTSG
jgi:hypothetical protein